MLSSNLRVFIAALLLAFAAQPGLAQVRRPIPELTSPEDARSIERPGRQQNRAPPIDDGDAAARLLAWLDAVHRHAPGQVDEAAIEVAGVPSAELVRVAADLKRLAETVHEGRRSIVELHDRRLTLGEVEKVFRGNDTVIRGAVLHSDIAIFVGRGTREAEGSAPQSMRQYGANDGRQDGVRHRTAHWRIARQVLDAVMPVPAADAGVLLWYRAASAYLLAEGQFADARDHLTRARELVPATPIFLLDSAYLHQKYSSHGIQAAVQEWRTKGIHLDVESRKIELERTERYLRQALALAPASGEVLMRLGHTLGEQGRHAEAAAELRKAIDASLDRKRRYLAELFLGRAEQALGRIDQADLRFRNAAELYPGAQSPPLALSLLARQAGDRERALALLRRVTERPPSGAAPSDPWWDFYQPHTSDAWALMRRVWRLAMRSAR